MADGRRAGDISTLVFKIRIDKAVEGARGKVEVVSGNGHPTGDPDPDDDTAAVPVSATGSTGTGDGLHVAAAAAGLLALAGIVFAGSRRLRRRRAG